MLTGFFWLRMDSSDGYIELGDCSSYPITKYITSALAERLLSSVGGMCSVVLVGVSRMFVY